MVVQVTTFTRKKNGQKLKTYVITCRIFYFSPLYETNNSSYKARKMTVENNVVEQT